MALRRSSLAAGDDSEGREHEGLARPEVAPERCWMAPPARRRRILPATPEFLNPGGMSPAWIERRCRQRRIV